jgi:hypothetical protein
MTNTDLDKIAHKLIASKIAAGETVHMAWAVQEILQGQGQINGDGVPFYKLCAREHMYRVVKKAVDKYDQTEPDHTQPELIFKGYHFLQVAYTVERNQEIQLIPIDLISDAELLARANQFETQARGLKAHAEEIKRYVLERGRAEALLERAVAAINPPPA